MSWRAPWRTCCATTSRRGPICARQTCIASKTRSESLWLYFAVVQVYDRAGYEGRDMGSPRVVGCDDPQVGVLDCRRDGCVADRLLPHWRTSAVLAGVAG